MQNDPSLALELHICSGFYETISRTAQTLRYIHLAGRFKKKLSTALVWLGNDSLAI